MVIIVIPTSAEIGSGLISNKEISQITDTMTREEVKNLVEVFYHPPFKTFYINSLDGKSFVRQTGVFVSLGITTSMNVIENIKEIIETHKGYSACIAEISSKKIAGQFMNTVIKTGSDIDQYELTEFDSNTMDRETSLKELDSLKEHLTEEEDLEILKNVTPKISKLSSLIQKLDKAGTWDSHLIQKDDEEDFRIFHKFVNYKKDGDIEYRIGIYVTEN